MRGTPKVSNPSHQLETSNDTRVNSPEHRKNLENESECINKMQQISDEMGNSQAYRSKFRFDEEYDQASTT